MTSSPELDPEAVRIGATIKSLREAYGWKLGELAKAIDRSHAYLSNIENGRKRAPVPLCSTIATVLKVPLAAIVSAEYAEAAERA